MNDITPEKVAAAACERAGGWLESLQGALSLTANGKVLSAEVVRWAEDDTETIHRFRAVVEAETTASAEPTRIVPTVFDIETEENIGATLIRMIDKNGRAVHVGLDDAMRNLLASMLHRTEPTRITAEQYHLSREDATGRVELTISGEGGAAVIDLGDDGDEILAGLLDIGQDDEDQDAEPLTRAERFADDLHHQCAPLSDPDNLAETCGDCMSGRCHGDGPCGCARHDASVEAAR